MLADAGEITGFAVAARKSPGGAEILRMAVDPARTMAVKLCGKWVSSRVARLQLLAGRLDSDAGMVRGNSCVGAGGGQGR